MILETLAEHAVGLGQASLPGEVTHAAKRCLIDWFSATLPGGLMPPATLLTEALSEETGRGRAVLLPSGRVATLRAAALINGTASHAAELDDIYRDALYHPGSPVIAAALATAQSRGASGDRFLRAIITGYEISTRIGVAVNPSHYEYWHSTGTVGTFGAAAAAATVLDLDKHGLVHALANAGTLAAGLQQAFRSDAMSKPLHAGRAAESGVLVALAAEKGFSGAPDILEGPRGFGAAMSDDPDWSQVVAGLSTTFNITKTTIKNYAACGHAFAAIDAVRALGRRHRLSPEHIKRVVVRTYAKALEVTGNARPRTEFEAKFSLPYCVSVALATGNVRLAAFTEERLKDPVIQGLMRRVELSVDPEAESAYPKRRAAVVEIETTNGSTLSYRAPTRKGDPDNPLSDDELTEKFYELAEPILGDRARSLLAALWRVDELASLEHLPVGEKVGLSAGGLG